MSETLENLKTDQDASFLSFMPGQRLRKARELRGLSVEDVAKEMHLSLRFVQAIEDDNYRELPEPAFVRGYMRRYAQLVKLSPDDIAAKFDQCWSTDNGLTDPAQRPDNPVRILGDFARRPRIPLRALLSLASLVLVLVTVVGTFLWARGERHVVAPEQTIPAESAPVPVAPAPVAQPLPLDTGAASPDAQQAATTDAVASAPVVAGTPLPMAPTPVAAPAVASAPAPAVAPVTATPVVSAVPLTAAAPALLFSVTADSWIRVIDAEGKTLVGELKHKGDVVSLTGKAPYSIHIGYAKGVSLTANGKPVDLQPYMSGNVATFKLNP